MRRHLALFLPLGSCSILLSPDPEGYIERTEILCADGVDNDGVDGADCEDPKCALTSFCDPCGNGTLDPDEACDDGNETPNDGCDPNCQPSGCNNGFLAPGESCFVPAGTAGIIASSDVGGLALGDFQGDGFLDLAVGDFNTTTPSVVFVEPPPKGSLLTLTSQPPLDTSSLVPDVAVGDLNSDGLDDFATPVKFSHAIGVFLSAPPGFSYTEFATAGPPSVDEPFGLVIADMDLDGDLDISTSNFASANVAIFLNDSTGKFDTLNPVLVSIAPGSIPERVAEGDINGDGVPDLVTANTSSGDISVVLSDGPLSYGSALTPSFSGDPQDLELADLNKDGFADLILTDVGLSRVLFFRGSPAGLSLDKEFSLSTGPCGVSLADIDVDGDIDAIVGDLGGGDITFFFNEGAGVMVQSPIPLSIPGASASYVISGDLNKDGFPDLAVSDIANSQAHFFVNQP